MLNGEFNETTTRVLFTLLMVIVHSLASLAFIWNDEKKRTFKQLVFFVNTLFTIIVVSFFTSIFGIWKILAAATVWHLYQTYFVLGFASLHCNILFLILNKENYINMTVYANYVFIGIVAVMLQPAIYISNAFDALGEKYFRLLGAAGIIDGTLTILAIIFYKLYMNKHPEEDSLFGKEQTVPAPEGKKEISGWVWVLAVYLFIQIISPLFYFLVMRPPFRPH